jgi:hypothetical protein
MRKALIAAAVATALFTVGAFAASFAVQSEDVASGANDVTACARQVDIDFDDPTLDTSTGAWTVAGATATFRDSADAAVTTCTGFAGELALKTGATIAGATYGSVSTATVSGSTADFNFTAVPVDTIHGASVVVDGKTLAADVAAPAAP